MTMDGGLERLVRILHDFCIAPPPPDNAALLYGLLPLSARPQKPLPQLNPPQFDKHAAYRFSLAFQCVVNIGVRGSEPIRSRVVQAGTLDVVGCILEAWLANKGFAVGPSTPALPPPRESREQRNLRRAQQSEQRQREEATQLQRQLQRQLQVIALRSDQDDPMDASSSSSMLLLPQQANSDTDVSTDNSIAPTPLESTTPTSASGVLPPTPATAATPTPTTTATGPTNLRDRSATIVARHQPPVHQQTQQPFPTTTTTTVAGPSRPARRTRHHPPSPSTSTDDPSPSRADTETEADIDMLTETDQSVDASSFMEDDSENDTSLSRHHLAHHRTTHHSLLNHHRRTRTATLTNVPGAAHAGVGPATDAPGSQPPVGPATTTATGAAAANSHIGVVISSDSESGATTPGGGAMPVGVGGSAGVDDAGILLLDGVRVDNNDDFAMGAPPGAPGALPLAAVGVGAEEGGNESNREDDDEQDESRTREADEGRTPRPSVAGSGPSASAGWYHAHHPHPHHHMRRRNTVDAASAPDVTPRAALVGLPLMAAEEDFTSTSSQPAVDDMGQPVRAHQMMGHSRNATIRQGEIGALTGAATASASGLGVFASSSSASTTPTPPFASTSATTAADPSTTATSPPPPSTTAASLSHSTSDDATTTNTANASSSNSSTSGSSTASSSPYRDEDVLLALQLLAYLSKYPHVRQAFYKPRVTFHPASVHLTGARFGGVVQTSAGQQAATQLSLAKEKEKDKGSKKDKEKAKDVKASSSASSSTASTSSSSSTIVAPATTGPPSAQRMTNVFSLVERFTYKPSSSASANGDAGGQVQTKLPTEIQYWAGVIMRNACRKDDSRGGIRQCANMLCGKWESFPREFAKCRRCRKAKYCGKECQSTAWSEGHRFWCSAKDAEEDTGANGTSGTGSSRRERERERGDRGDREREREGGEIGVSITGSTGPTVVPVQGGTTTGTGTGTGRRRERDRERERERTRRSANATGATILPSPPREDAPPTTMGIHEQIRASLPPTSPSPSPSPGPSGSGVQQRRSESPTPPASGSRTTSSSSNPRRHSAQPPVPSRAEGPNSPTSITGPSINNHTGIPLPFYPTMATMEGRRAYASSVLASYAGMGLGWLQQVQPSAQGSGSGSGSGSTLTATSASAPTGGGSGGVRLPPLYGSTPGAGSPISVPHFTQQQQQQQQPPQGYGPGGQVIPHAARFSGPVAALHSASGSGSGSGTRAAASVPAASGSSSSSSSPSGASASARRYPFGGTTGAGAGSGFLSMRSPPPSVPDDDDDDQAGRASASSGRGAAGNGTTYLYPQSRARGGPSADVGSHGGRSRFLNVVEIEGEAEGDEEDGMMLG